MAAWAGLVPDPKKIGTFGKEEEKRTEDLVAYEKLQREQQAGRDRDYSDRMKYAWDQEHASMLDIQPWNPRTMAPQPHDLWEKIGSPGFIIAMLGSRFSAMPMNTALAAGGAALKAINEGDMDGYNRAFEEWKVNSELAEKRHSLIHTELEDIGKIWDKDTAAGKARMESYLQQIGDERKLGLLRAGLSKDVWDAVAAESNAFKDYAQARTAMYENNALIAGFNEGIRQGMKPEDAWAYSQRKISEAKASGRYGLTASAQQMQEVVKRDQEWLKNNPQQPDESNEDYEKRREIAHDTHMSDVVTAGKPLEARRINLAEWKAQKDEEHKQLADDVKNRKITLDEAKAKVDEDYKQTMADIAARRLDASITKEAATEAWRKRKQDLDERKFEVSKPVRDKARRDALTADIIDQHRGDPSWTAAKTIEAVEKQIAADDAAAKAKPGTPKQVQELADKAIIEAGLRAEHPDWDDRKIIEARNREYTASVSRTTSRSPASMAIQKFMEQHPEAGADDVLHFAQVFTQAISRARTLGTRSANIDTAVVEVKKFAQAAIAASAKVPRTDWQTINDYWERGLTETSSPEMGVFDKANRSLVTAYGQTMSRNGGNTVAYMQAAENLLKTKEGPAAYKAGAEFLIFEAELVQMAVGEVSAARPGGGNIKSIEKIGD
jgi:hypothetical protein